MVDPASSLTQRNSMSQTIELPVSWLKNACAGFAKVIQTRNTLPVLGHVRLEADPSGLARIQATDLDTTITSRTQIETPGGFPACLLPFDRLQRIVRGAHHPLSLVHEADRVSIRTTIGSSTVAQALETLPIEEWPQLPPLQASGFTADNTFKKALREALECASRDSSRYVLNGAFLDLTDPDCHTVVATDGRHLLSANTFRFDLPESVIIPTRRFLTWSGFNEDGNWRVAVSPKLENQPTWIQIQAEHWTFLTKALEGTYPNWRQVLPSADRPLTRLTFSQEAVNLMLEALPRMPGAEEPDQRVQLAVERGQFILASRPMRSTEWSRVPIPGATIDGDDRSIALNRGYLIRALQFGFATMEFGDELSALLFTAPGRQMVVMPLRLDGPTVSPEPATPETNDQPAPAPTPAGQPKETAMPKTQTPPPTSGEPQPRTESNGAVLRQAMDRIETIRNGLRQLTGDLSETTVLLKAVEKEKRTNEKEIETVRATLRSLQKVTF
jgi:DNA polymerase III sliding clamp (beta) subunit (PCNA family)